MFVSTVGTSYTQNGSFAVAALYEPVYMQAIMVGQAIAGIVPPLGSMLSALSYANSDNDAPDSNKNNGTDEANAEATPLPPDTNSSSAQWSSFGFFIAATTLALAAIILYIVSINKGGVAHEPDESNFLSYSDEAEEEELNENVGNDETAAFLSTTGEGESSSSSMVRPSTPALLHGDSVTDSLISNPEVTRHHTHSSALVEDEEALAKGNHHTPIPLTYLLSKLLVPSVTVFLVFSVTLAYPVFASRVLSSTFKMPSQLYIPLVFFVWNLGDLFGRISCAYPQLIVTKNKSLILYGVGRLLFLPLFTLLFAWKGHNDVLYLLLQFIFGITNGHLCSSTFIQMPNYVEEKEREAAGGFMTLSLSLGLSVGSLLSFVLSAILDSISS